MRPAPLSGPRRALRASLQPRRRPEPCRAQAGADRDAFPAARLAAPHAACDDACATLSYDDWQQGYECAACWHVEDADPALPLQPGERLHLRPSHREVPHPVPTRRPAAMAAHLTVASYVEASAEEAGEGLSDLEEWVFSSACEAAACWQAELAHGAGGAVAGAVAPAAGAARSTNGGRATVKPDGDGPMDQDALEAWRHAGAERAPTRLCARHLFRSSLLPWAASCRWLPASLSPRQAPCLPRVLRLMPLQPRPPAPMPPPSPAASRCWRRWTAWWAIGRPSPPRSSARTRRRM